MSLAVLSVPGLGSTVRLLGAAGNVLPGSIESASSASKKTLLFFFLEVAVDLLLIDLGNTEQRCDEDDEVYAEEGELCPEHDDTKEGEVDGDTVNEGAQDGRCADVLCGRVLGEFATGLDKVFVLGTVGLLIAGVGAQVAVGLGAECGVLRCDYHSNGVVDAKNDEGEQNGGHEESLGRGVSLADLEEGEPEEADTCSRDADNRGGEEEQDQQEEQDVVDREDLGRLDKDPVQWLEDVDVAEDVTTVGTADGVLRLVDAGDEHAGEDDQGNNDQKKATDELEGAEDGLDLDPCLNDPVTVLTTRFSSKTLAADKGALLTDKRLEFAPVTRIESTVAAFVAAFKLPLALTVGLKLRSSVGG